MDMVIMVGVAGSSKTTLARAEYGLLERVSLDDVHANPAGRRALRVMGSKHTSRAH